MSTTQRQWEEATVRLLDDEYAFLASGPRRHADWREDVLPVMERSVRDPRGWITLDWDADDKKRLENRFYPFTRPTVRRLRDDTYEISAESAAALLVLMTNDWFGAADFSHFGKDYAQLLYDADTVLSRYGTTSTFFTTSTDARRTSAPNFRDTANGGMDFTGFLHDLGLISVSDKEVGVIWRFNAN